MTSVEYNSGYNDGYREGVADGYDKGFSDCLKKYSTDFGKMRFGQTITPFKITNNISPYKVTIISGQ